jgi:sigma-E factor negative regulatory protein RseC
MEASVCIEQKGTVESIVGHLIKVKIFRESSCDHCNTRAICNLSDISERIIETNNTIPGLKIGDPVRVSISRSMGNKAVLLGYLLPFVILITVLLVLSSLGLDEWLSGTLSLIVLIPYYIVLYMLRDRLRRSFTFTINKPG